MPCDSGPEGPDQQKTDDDRENNDQIEIFFGHCPCVSIKRQSNAETVTKRAKNCRDCRRRPEMSSRRQPQDALVLLVRYTNGRFGPLVRLLVAGLN